MDPAGDNLTMIRFSEKSTLTYIREEMRIQERFSPLAPTLSYIGTPTVLVSGE